MDLAHGIDPAYLISGILTLSGLMIALLGGALIQITRCKSEEPKEQVLEGFDVEPVEQPAKKSLFSRLARLNPATALPAAIPLPSEVLDYCEDESEEFARDDCKSRARNHFADSQNWDRVLISLRREDG